jgi:hypothetical protein
VLLCMLCMCCCGVLPREQPGGLRTPLQCLVGLQWLARQQLDATCSLNLGPRLWEQPWVAGAYTCGGVILGSSWKHGGLSSSCLCTAEVGEGAEQSLSATVCLVCCPAL